MERVSNLTRKTKETDISININIDGKGDYYDQSKISTGIGFFDHMLELFGRHGFFDLKISANGDIEVDGHHTVEDVGIVLGTAIKNALGTKEGIKRYGSFMLPMDETLVMCAVDLSGRPFLVFDGEFTSPMIGNFDTQLVEEFFRAVAFNAGMTLHIKLMYGKNSHHIVEAMFKAFGRALDEAVTVDDRIIGVMSTKGSL